MIVWDIVPLMEELSAQVRRAYRHSELRKWRHWLQGKSLHWAFYLTAVSLVAGGILGLYSYLHSFLYVVSVDGQEVGLVQSPLEIEEFLASLSRKGSSLYGRPVVPREEISLAREYRPREEADTRSVQEALRRRVTLVAEALMVTVDGKEVVPVEKEEDVSRIIQILNEAYVRRQDNIKLLEVYLVEAVEGRKCKVPPEDLWLPEDVAALLMGRDQPREIYLASRGDPAGTLTGRYGLEATQHQPELLSGSAAPQMVHVTTVEEVTVIESIPFQTTYTYNNDMWTVQSRVIKPGQYGKKEVTYHVTRVNGEETARREIASTVLEQPTTQVVERGTARVPSYGTGQFIWPIPADSGARITQRFRGIYHRGIDLTHVAGSRTPIYAADDGVVVCAERRGTAGNYIIVYHGAYYTLYLHNSVNLVKAGDVVSQGQTIAYMGSTGRSTGVHLHFEIRRSDGSGEWRSWDQNPPLNPLDFFHP